MLILAVVVRGAEANTSGGSISQVQDWLGPQEEFSVAAEMEKMRSTDGSDGLRIKSIVEQGTNVVPEVIVYLEDSNESIRQNSVIILGILRDPRAVDPLMGCLQDQYPTVRRRAILALNKIVEKNPSAVQESYLPVLVQYAKETDGNAYLVMPIIGTVVEHGDIPAIKEILEVATSQIGLGGGSAVLGKKNEKECLKVLAKLGDDAARNQASHLLMSDILDDKIKGIEIVSYVGEDMVAELGPLLLDKQDAVDITASHSGLYMLRVCDLAADAIRDTYPVEMDSQKRTHYTDDDLLVIQNRLRVKKGSRVR